MSLEKLTIGDLVRVAAAGGGLRLSARNRTAGDLVRLAAACKDKAHLTLIDLEGKTAGDLVRIAAAGGGSVVFADA